MSKIVRLKESDVVNIVKRILTEQQVTKQPIKIGCRDYDKIEKYCTNIKFSKSEVDSIGRTNTSQVNQRLLEKIDNMSNSIKKIGGEDNKVLAERFSKSINSAKKDIVKILSKYYYTGLYSLTGQGWKINKSTLTLEIMNIIYSLFLKGWNSSIVDRNVAKYYVDEKNIEKVQKVGKDLLENLLIEIESIVDFYFSDLSAFVIDDYTRSKSTPKCTDVIITQDRGCNDLPKEKWYSPNKKYITTYQIYGDYKSAFNTYSPILTKFLNSLV